MTIDVDRPDHAGDLMRIHRVITRGLEIALQCGREFQQSDFPGAAIQAGYTMYTKCLLAIIHAHHITEDEVAFPELQRRLPDRPYIEFNLTHQRIAEALSKLTPLADRLGEADHQASLNELLSGLNQVYALWRPHIALEEQSFTRQAIDAVMELSEQANLSSLAARHTQQHSGPAPLATPFLLYNLVPEDRLVLVKVMPPELTQVLVPVTWKDQWAPMKPFLLE